MNADNLLVRQRHVTSACVTTGTTAIKGAEAAQQAAHDWQAVRADQAIQYAPVPQTPPPETPEWLKELGEILRSVLEPLGRALGMSWPVLQWLLLGLAVLAALYMLWRLFGPWLLRPRAERIGAEAEWAPDRGEALALLEDADRLAAEGHFDEATHLLLKRSVAQIALARSDWVHPASTAREIARIEALPNSARTAFSVISGRVERSLFALVALDGADWQAARAAYADFALERFPAKASA